MRSRNIKPGFFENEELAELSFECRLLYIGLWCYADREGRFEWRPKRIKALIFPYDNLDINELLNVITCNGHVITYNDNEKTYGYIPTFLKHNRPHPHEAKSQCPPPPKNINNKKDNKNQLYNDDVITCNDMVLQCNDMSVKCKADIMNDDIMNDDKRKYDSMPPIKYLLFKEKWNLIAIDPVKKINEVTDKRKKKIKTRYKEHSNFYEIFSQCIEKIKGNDFFYGNNDKKWSISFDWLIYDDTNYVKVWEGKYDNNKRDDNDGWY